MTECLAFLDQWTEDPNGVKPVFMQYKDLLTSCEGRGDELQRSPGHHLFAARRGRGLRRDLFVMVDVVDDDPAERWLSVCFYDDQVSDPDELGDWAPEGLAGQDARCFCVDSAEDESMVTFTAERIREAFAAAKACAGAKTPV